MPTMTLAEQVIGAKALARLTLEVARLIIEIIKLIKTYRSATSPRPAVKEVVEVNLVTENKI